MGIDTIFRPFVDACESKQEDRVAKVFEALLTRKGAEIVNGIEVTEEERAEQLRVIDHYFYKLAFKAPESRYLQVYQPCLAQMLTPDQIDALTISTTFEVAS